MFTNIFFTDYDGYDDVYGHSMDDDYCISPSNRHYLYNRENSARSSESDIKEENELEAQLEDQERTKLDNCLDQIKEKMGFVNLSRNEIIKVALDNQFDVQKTIDVILSNSGISQIEPGKEKGDFEFHV